MIYNALNQMKAKNLSGGKYADGQGLWLVKRNRIAGKWILRLAVNGKRREMGLGRWPDVSIAEAREKAEAARRQLRDGEDPIQQRASVRQRVKRLTVEEAIFGCFEARQAELKGDGKAGRWLSPLAVHIIPAIGSVAIEDVDQHLLKRVLDPIWHEKPDTARKAVNRLNLTLKHAAALGLDVDLQATMKARALLGKQRHTVQHVPSIPYPEAPAFYQMLCSKPYQSCLALRFLMLTAARTSEIRFARKDDIEDCVLTIPRERTKTHVEHRIPLSEEALRVVSEAHDIQPSDLLFPSPRGKPMSDATMARFMEREGYDARPHGFRATFRTWVEEQTDTPYEVKEASLGHVTDNEVVRAYPADSVRRIGLGQARAQCQQWKFRRLQSMAAGRIGCSDRACGGILSLTTIGAKLCQSVDNKPVRGRGSGDSGFTRNPHHSGSRSVGYQRGAFYLLGVC